MADDRAGIGVVGCGYISDEYAGTLVAEPSVRIVACADVEPGRAQALASRTGAVAVGVDELLADPRVDVVLNLTPPAEHADVNVAALKAGRHVYCEKPLTTEASTARYVVGLGERSGLRVGAAPDTFLADGLEQARAAIGNGLIGEPVGASVAFGCGGHETWHPRPEFFYRRGGGPLYDMGPYYLTALAVLLGPVIAVTAAGRTRSRAGTARPGRVEVPTHVCCVLELADGRLADCMFSFDAPEAVSRLEIHGTEATLCVPRPASFDGRPHIRRDGREAPCGAPPRPLGRGVGLVEMVAAMREERPHRACGDLAVHVVEILEAAAVSMRSARREIVPPPRHPNRWADGRR